jgi:DNA-binding transcriptional regulator GbsR (MarR family)
MIKDTAISKIQKALALNKSGLTIQQLMEKTDLARGTVKTYLDELKRIGRVHEEEYGQNTKVFFLNGAEIFQKKVQMYDDGVLFVDVLTNPWKKPFIRVKLRNKKDIGAIFLNNEKAIDELIEALKKVKPRLQEYRDLLKNIEESAKET